MICFMCKGDMKEATTTYMSEYNGCYIIIKNVPCTRCTQCGEEYLNGVTLKKIETILEKLKSMLTEIAVVDYTKAA
ncbi:type II toxin-antitoxin system MqsA family antitoxin [Eubacterium limosum]|uniref:type II toxin-antitoxin system MqsA family antitoxin n=1 Tax=Eubacterium limosum TaxID=1736 RepID=UPI0010631ACC|nr:type II toxin-antitoxin system MqsA family antitoxin [Eubacterium limosum]